MELIPAKGSDGEVFALFLDMLGFSDLVETYPHAAIRRTDVSGSITTTETAVAASVFQRFHRTLEHLVTLNMPEYRPSSMMIFSDSAFLILDNALLAALSATELMRDLLSSGVPVRMGLAYGTCSVQRFTSDAIPGFRLTRAMFFGTAIVRSHQAEHRGGKGCRIFVHHSLREFLPQIERDVKVLTLTEPNKFAEWELCYLHREVLDYDLDSKTGRPGYVDQHLKLLRGLRSIQQNSDAIKPLTAEVQIHYSETFAAIDRMREAMGLRDLSIEEAEEAEDEELES